MTANTATASLRDAMTVLRAAEAGSHGQLGADTILQSLRQLAEPPVFKRLLWQLISDDEFLKQAASVSYRHVLGFDKILLMPALPSGRLRLHIWSDPPLEFIEHPHNHRYSSYSAVVTGKLRMDFYQPGEVGSAAIHYQETTAPGESLASFVRLGVTRLFATKHVEIASGDAYSMSARTVHQIHAPQELTVTIFLELARVRSSSDIFVHERDPIPCAQAHRYFEIHELRDRLRQLQKAFEEL